MSKVIKKKPPSRIRYEQSHPTVSCRVSKEIYDRLQAIKKTEKKSFADILKIGLGIITEAKKEKTARQKSYRLGFSKGYAEAEREYKVTYACSVCGRRMTVHWEREKAAIAKYMTESGWAHKDCR